LPQCQIYSSNGSEIKVTKRTEKLKVPPFAERRYAGGGGMEVQLYLLLTSALDVGGQLHAADALTPGKELAVPVVQAG